MSGLSFGLVISFLGISFFCLLCAAKPHTTDRKKMLAGPAVLKPSRRLRSHRFLEDLRSSKPPAGFAPAGSWRACSPTSPELLNRLLVRKSEPQPWRGSDRTKHGRRT